MYRVRKSWSDDKSQLGAFSILQNAKFCAHDGGIEYSVFDDSGKVIYKVTENDWFRVRTSWADSNSQVGAYWKLDVAKQYADSAGKNVYDWDGNEIYKGNKANPSIVKTMSYTAKLLKKVGKYAKGSKVTVTRNYKKEWVLPDGTTIDKDKKSTYFDLLKQIYDPNCKYSAAVAEAWINQRGTSSATEWLFWCNKYGQRVYVFKGKKGAWKLQKTFKCGTGNIDYGDGSDQGVNFGWKIWNKDKVFQGPRAKQYYNMHYSSAWGNSIHQGSVGKPSTHGCIGLAKDSAIWAFETLPINTRVVVY